MIERALVDHFYFIDDDSVMMDTKNIDGFNDFNFSMTQYGRAWKSSMHPAKQYVHHSGTLFIRLVRDKKGWVIFIVYENRQYIKGDDELLKLARGIFRDVYSYFISVGT